jgi:tetratricopeptide (TPR) repeat protein
VFDCFSKKLASLVTVSLLVAGGAFAQAPAAAKAPAVKDQGEYDLTQALTKEKDPQKQMDILKQWEQKYPDSDFKGPRSVQMAQADSQMANKGVQPGATPADVDTATKAAQDLADNLDKYLSAENKPAGATDDQWKAAHQQLEQQAHTVIAMLSMGKKTPDADAAAEKEFKRELALFPGDASAAYTLGTLIIRERKVERIPEALFYLAKAIQITGPQALTPQGKTAAETYFKKSYIGYHGDDSGIDDLKKAAASAPTMPPDFKLESVTDIAKKQEGDAAAFAAANPDKALWRQIRGALTAADGDMYFTQIKDAAVPPAGQAGFTMFRAKVVSQPSPKELLVNVDSLAGDATLKFENPLKGTIDPGSDIKFKGVVDSFVKDPYMLTFTADKEDVDGIPAAAFAGAPPPVRKRTVTKKK